MREFYSVLLSKIGVNVMRKLIAERPSVLIPISIWVFPLQTSAFAYHIFAFDRKRGDILEARIIENVAIFQGIEGTRLIKTGR